MHMNRKILSTAIAIGLLLTGTACGTDTSGAAEVVEQVEDELGSGDSEGSPEATEDTAEGSSTDEGSTDDGADAPEVQPGGVLEGAPIPRDAAIGQADTAYTDTVLGTETTYWGFDIEPGTEVQGEIIISPNPDVTDTSACGYISLTDEGTTEYIYKSLSGNPQEQAIVGHTDPFVVDADQVWIEVEPISCSDDDAPFDVEVQVTTVN
jgi:hypothetical protein